MIKVDVEKTLKWVAMKNPNYLNSTGVVEEATFGMIRFVIYKHKYWNKCRIVLEVYPNKDRHGFSWSSYTRRSSAKTGAERVIKRELWKDGDKT